MKRLALALASAALLASALPAHADNCHAIFVAGKGYVSSCDTSKQMSPYPPGTPGSPDWRPAPTPAPAPAPTIVVIAPEAKKVTAPAKGWTNASDPSIGPDAYTLATDPVVAYLYGNHSTLDLAGFVPGPITDASGRTCALAHTDTTTPTQYWTQYHLVCR